MKYEFKFIAQKLKMMLHEQGMARTGGANFVGESMEGPGMKACHSDGIDGRRRPLWRSHHPVECRRQPHFSDHQSCVHTTLYRLYGTEAATTDGEGVQPSLMVTTTGFLWPDWGVGLRTRADLAPKAVFAESTRKIQNAQVLRLTFVHGQE